MRVGVVGGTGTFGNLAVKELALRGHEVVALSRTARTGTRRSSITSRRSRPRARPWMWRRSFSAAAEPVWLCGSSGPAGCVIAYSSFPGTPPGVAKDDSQAALGAEM
jgi:hypothetical protein